MDDLQFVGNVVTAVITLGGFIAVIIKFIQPINDLRVVIQKLNECVQFKHWTFEDLKESIYDDFECGDDLKQFYNEGKPIQEAAERLDAWTWIFM